MRRLLASLAALLAAVLALPLVGAAADAAPASSPDAAMSRLGSCIRSTAKADLLFMIDTSGSLGQSVGGQPPSDPTAQRVTAAKYLLSQLAQHGTRIELDIALAGFDTDLHQVGGWQQLTPSSLGGLDGQLDTFTTADNGIDTDYESAFSSALGTLRTHAPSGGRCQAILWFTDGSYSIQPRQTPYQRQMGLTKPYAPGVDISTDAGAAAATAAGTAALCNAGATADQLRADNVLTFAVGLGGAGGDFGLMQAIATGTSPSGQPCGSPVGSTTVGSFTLAANVDDIIFAFDQFDPFDPPVQATQQICQSAAACSSSRTFVLDPSINRVHILADTTKPSVQVVLTPPGGAPAATLTSKAPVTGLANLSGTWVSDHVVDLTLAEQPGNPWQGQWSISFVDPTASSSDGVAKSSIRIAGDLVPRDLDGSTLSLRSGTQPVTHIGIVDGATGTPVSSLLGTATVTATLTTPSGTALPLASAVPFSQLAGGTTIDLSHVSPGAATLALTLQVTTAGPDASTPGTALAPQEVDVPVTVLAPPSYPTVGTKVDFGHATGTKGLTAQLPVSGPGCVWVDGVHVTASPGGLTNPAVAASANGHGSCVTVAAGRHGSVPLTFHLRTAATGLVAGTLTAHLEPAGGGSPLTESVAFVADGTKPANKAVLWGTFTVALLLGIGLPILLLALVRYLGARVPRGVVLLADIPITVRDGSVLRDSGPLRLAGSDVTSVPVPRGTHRLVPPGTDITVVTKAGFNLLAAPHAHVTVPGHSVVSPGAGLPVALCGGWCIAVPTVAGGTSRLIAFLAGTAGPEAYERLVDDVVRSAADLVAPVTPPEPPAEQLAGGWGSSAPQPADQFAGGWGGAAPEPAAAWGGPTPAPDPAPAAAPAQADTGWSWSTSNAASAADPTWEK